MEADFDLNSNDVLNGGKIYTDRLFLDGQEVSTTNLVTSGALLIDNNLSDLSDVNAAVANLGLTASIAELNSLDGILANVQTQINSLITADTTFLPLAGGTVTGDLFIDNSDLTIINGGDVTINGLAVQKTYASFAEFIADTETFTAGEVVSIPSIGGFYKASATTGNLGQTNAGLQEFDVVYLDGYNALWFGAVGDGATNDTAAIQAALDSDGAIVRLSGGASGFLLDTSLTVPVGKALVGDYEFIDPRNGALFNDANYPSRIILNSAATITLNESASLKGLPILRKGLVMPANAAAVASFAGTAINTAALSSGQYIGYCAILGFAQAIATDAATNTEQLRCEYLNIDCQAGILVEQCFDIAYLNNVHCWPTASVAVAGVVDADLQRTGIGIHFKDGGDWNKATDCFTYGYLYGFKVENCNSVNLIGCGADNTYTGGVPTYTGSRGFWVEGTSIDTALIGCEAAAQVNQGIYINTSASFHTLVSNCRVWGGATQGVLIAGGDVTVIGNTLRDCTYGVVENNASSRITVDLNRFYAIVTRPIWTILASTTMFIGEGNDFGNWTGAPVSGSVLPTVASIASADPLIPPNSSTVFDVTGTTNFGSLYNGYAGRVITLVFSGVLTVTSSTTATTGMRLSGGVNFTAGAGKTLTLAHNGSYWLEIGRSS
jgi:hypothetical protein